MTGSVQYWLEVHRLRLAGWVAALGLAAMATQQARADGVWLGGSADSKWNEPFNWSPLGVPGASDTAFFNSNVGVRSIAEFNGGTTEIGNLSFSGQSSLHIDPYGLKGNVLSALNISTLLFLGSTPQSATTNASFDNMIVNTPSTTIGTLSTLAVTNHSALHNSGQLSLIKEGHLSVTSGAVTAGIIAMSDTSGMTADSTSNITVTGLLDFASAGSININGGSLTVGKLQIHANSSGNAGSVNITANGVLTLTGDGLLMDAGTLTVDSTSFFSSVGGMIVEDSGVLRDNSILAPASGTSLSVFNGGKAFGSRLDLAIVPAFSTTAGFLLSGGSSSVTFDGTSTWGASLGTATALFQDSAIGTFNNLTIGANGGHATITIINSAQLTTTGTLLMGTSGGSGSSVFAVIGGGTLTSNGKSSFLGGTSLTLVSGGLVLGDDGTFAVGSTFKQIGGTFTMPAGKTLRMDGAATLLNSTIPSTTLNFGGGGSVTWNGTTLFQSGAFMNLQQSTGKFNGDVTFSTGSTFNWTGGTWSNAPGTTLAFDGGAGSFAVPGGGVPGRQVVSDGSTLRITSGGALTTNSTFWIADGAVGGAHGTMFIDGGSFASTAAGSLNVSIWSFLPADAATVTFQNSGVGSFNAGLAIGILGGAATVNLQSSAQFNTASLQAGNSSGLSNGVKINVNSATLNIVGGSTFDNGATLNLQTNGSVNFGGNTTFHTGSIFNWSGGTWNNAAGTTLAFDGGAGSFFVAGGGNAGRHVMSNGSTLQISNAGTVSTNSFFIFHNGTMLVQNPGSKFTSTATSLNSPTGWGTFPGDAVNVTFSDSGFGSFNGGLAIGTGGAATVNLLSSAQLNTASILAGNASGGVSDGATITINNATLNIAGTASFLKGAKLNLQSGSAIFGGNTTFSTGSTFNWSGGAWNNAAGTTLTFDGGAGSFAISKSAPDQSTVRITNGGVLTTSAVFDIGNSFTTPAPSGAHGTLLVSGGSLISNTTTLGQSAWGNYTGDIATVTFSNSGVGSFNQGLHIGQQGGAATVSLQSSAQLNTASLLAGCNFGPSDGVNITVNSAALSVVGAATFANGAVFNLQSGSVNFNGGATFATGSTFNWSGGGWDNAAGTTLALDGGVA